MHFCLSRNLSLDIFQEVYWEWWGIIILRFPTVWGIPVSWWMIIMIITIEWCSHVTSVIGNERNIVHVACHTPCPLCVDMFERGTVRIFNRCFGNNCKNANEYAGGDRWFWVEEGDKKWSREWIGERGTELSPAPACWFDASLFSIHTAHWLWLSSRIESRSSPFTRESLLLSFKSDSRIIRSSFPSFLPVSMSVYLFVFLFVCLSTWTTVLSERTCSKINCMRWIHLTFNVNELKRVSEESPLHLHLFPAHLFFDLRPRRNVHQHRLNTQVE